MIESVQVLDEADRLLTPTFAPELSFIIDQLPTQRQTLLFTATLTDAVLALQNKPHTDPTKPKVFTHVSKDQSVLPFPFPSLPFSLSLVSTHANLPL